MATWPYPVHLDRMMQVTGGYDSGTGNTTWVMPSSDESIDAIIPGSDFGSLAGTVLTPDTVVGDTVTLAGNYSAGPVILGRKFSLDIELSPQYTRTADGFSRVDVWTQIRRITSTYERTTHLTIKAEQNNRADRSKSIALTAKADGLLSAWFRGKAPDITISLLSEEPGPCVVPSLEILVDDIRRNG
jgi:hypothetical protein